MQKGTVISAIIGTSLIVVIIGFYIGCVYIGFPLGFIRKDILLVTLAVIELFFSFIVEITGAFKDRLNKKEKELAKFLDVQKLRDKIYVRVV